MNADPKRELLRHMVATVAFRGRIAIENTPAGFADFRAAGSTRSPAEILAHIGDLLIGSRHLLRGEFVEMVSKPLPWDQEISRFFSAVNELDTFLASDQQLAHPVEKMVQGPIGDALTHVGQIVLLRRIAGAPINQASYFTAEVVPGS
ncbi:MAG: hypothetical protein ACRD43_11700 [Pyrinomonadaceae bacterium]